MVSTIPVDGPGRRAGRAAAPTSPVRVRGASTTRGRPRWRAAGARPGAGRRARPARPPGGAPVRAVHRPARARWPRCGPPARPPCARRDDGDARRRRRCCAPLGCRRSAASLVPRLIRPAARAGAATRRGRAGRPARTRSRSTPTSPPGRGLAWECALAASAVAGGARRRVARLGLAAGSCLLPLVPVGVALAVVDWRTRLLPTRDRAAGDGVRRGASALPAGPLDRRRRRPGPRRARAGWSPRAVFWLLWFDLPARAWASATSGSSALLGLALGLPRAGASCWSGSTPASWSSGVPGLLLALVRRDRRLLQDGLPVRPVHAGRRAGRASLVGPWCRG